MVFSRSTMGLARMRHVMMVMMVTMMVMMMMATMMAHC